MLLTASASTASAQYPGQAHPAQGLRPVPRDGTRMVTPTPNRHSTQALSWRRSQNVAPQPQVSALSRPVSEPAAQSAVRQVSSHQPLAGSVAGLQVTDELPRLEQVSQTAWMAQPNPVDDLLSPPTELQVAQSPQRTQDFFSDPFGEKNAMPRTPPRQASPTLPPQSRPMNDLRDSFGFPQTPDPSPEATDRQPIEDGPSLGDMLREESPSDRPAGDLPALEEVDEFGDRPKAETLPPPRTNGGRDELFDNPFPGRRDAGDKKADTRDRQRLNRPGNDTTDDDDQLGLGDDDLRNPGGITCDEFRRRIAFQTIDKVSLDISPPYRPDEIEQARYERLKEEFDEKQSIRQWRNIDGTPLASGRLRDLAYEKAIIETEFGTTEKLPIELLSEADLAYISDNWGLPQECRLEQVAYAPRQWTPMTMTWKASNLCHKPLYFEDVNLERYGHTRGPVLEPIVQTAHFFGNIAVLPYKMGVHAPTECVYSLGYYRPGNCAPWITPPVPISLRGALYQTAAMTGTFLLIP